ncbi:MAG: SMP-30/gluconolactonase/LRE family protein [candidate division KSB1 bacterium]|nr:SMP-30/gluconolactonase/LRE family protein [candidate division KSB1 bacterium]
MGRQADGLAALKKAGVLPDYAQVVQLGTGFRFTEGPASDEQGNVYFSDIPADRIYFWSLDGTIVLFRRNTGGANGLFLDRAGNLYICEGKNRRVTVLSPDGTLRILAERYQGKRLNSPNDLWVSPNGGVYFTDPRYGPRDDLEQDGEHVYFIPPDRTQVIRVIDDLVRPNGIIGTPDGKILYVADHGGEATYAYDIAEDGSLRNKRLFVRQGSDGMTLDERGNLYLTSGSVTVYAPSGEKLGEILLPEQPTNVTFAGRGGRLLFVTARSSVYAVPTAVRGWQWRR